MISQVMAARLPVFNRLVVIASFSLIGATSLPALAQDECSSAQVLTTGVPVSFTFSPGSPTPSAN